MIDFDKPVRLTDQPGIRVVSFARDEDGKVIIVPTTTDVGGAVACIVADDEDGETACYRFVCELENYTEAEWRYVVFYRPPQRGTMTRGWPSISSRTLEGAKADIADLRNKGYPCYLLRINHANPGEVEVMVGLEGEAE